MFEAFGLSALAVAIAEIGDKTQLLAILLAAKFGRPACIISGIALATLANHALAAAAGELLADYLSGPWFRLAVGAGFLAMALWTLIPDKQDQDAGLRAHGGVFVTTVVAFFLVEMGDKTQVATVLLAARFHEPAMVALGTTAGMVLANAPAVWIGQAGSKLVPLQWVRITAAAVFAMFGFWLVAAAAGLLSGIGLG